MKKILFALPIIVLIAAGCNSSQQVSVQTPTPVVQNTNPAPSPTPTPTPSMDGATHWKTYINTKYGYQIMFPAEATLATEDLNLGAAGHKVVKSFPSNADYVTIQNGYAFVSICGDCGGYGVGVNDEKVEENLLVNNTEPFRAKGFFANNAEGSHKIMFVDLSSVQKFTIKYGFQSDYGKPLSQTQIDTLNRLNSEILLSFKFIN